MGDERDSEHDATPVVHGMRSRAFQRLTYYTPLCDSFSKGDWFTRHAIRISCPQCRVHFEPAHGAKEADRG